MKTLLYDAVHSVYEESVASDLFPKYYSYLTSEFYLTIEDLSLNLFHRPQHIQLPAELKRKLTYLIWERTNSGITIDAKIRKYLHDSATKSSLEVSSTQARGCSKDKVLDLPSQATNNFDLGANGSAKSCLMLNNGCQHSEIVPPQSRDDIQENSAVILTDTIELDLSHIEDSDDNIDCEYDTHNDIQNPVEDASPQNGCKEQEARVQSAIDAAWNVYFSDDGYPYHYNSILQESSWDCPLELYLDRHDENRQLREDEDDYYRECECMANVLSSGTAPPFIYTNEFGDSYTNGCYQLNHKNEDNQSTNTTEWNDLHVDSNSISCESKTDHVDCDVFRHSGDMILNEVKLSEDRKRDLNRRMIDLLESLQRVPLDNNNIGGSGERINSQNDQEGHCDGLGEINTSDSIESSDTVTSSNDAVKPVTELDSNLKVCIEEKLDFAHVFTVDLSTLSAPSSSHDTSTSMAYKNQNLSASTEMDEVLKVENTSGVTDKEMQSCHFDESDRRNMNGVDTELTVDMSTINRSLASNLEKCESGESENPDSETGQMSHDSGDSVGCIENETDSKETLNQGIDVSCGIIQDSLGTDVAILSSSASQEFIFDTVKMPERKTDVSLSPVLCDDDDDTSASPSYEDSNNDGKILDGNNDRSSYSSIVSHPVDLTDSFTEQPAAIKNPLDESLLVEEEEKHSDHCLPAVVEPSTVVVNDIVTSNKNNMALESDSISDLTEQLDNGTSTSTSINDICTCQSCQHCLERQSLSKIAVSDHRKGSNVNEKGYDDESNPKNWEVHFTEDGDDAPYHFNAITGTSVWDCPHGLFLSKSKHNTEFHKECECIQLARMARLSSPTENIPSPDYFTTFGDKASDSFSSADVSSSNVRDLTHLYKSNSTTSSDGASLNNHVQQRKSKEDTFSHDIEALSIPVSHKEAMGSNKPSEYLSMHPTEMESITDAKESSIDDNKSSKWQLLKKYFSSKQK